MAPQNVTSPLVIDLGAAIPLEDGYDAQTFTWEASGHTVTGETFKTTSNIPPGMALSAAWPDANRYLYGTPTTAGDYAIYLQAPWNDALETYPSTTITVTIAEPAPETVTAEPPVFDDEDYTVTVPAVAGVAYLVGGVDTPAGTVSASPGTTVTVTAEPADAGYVLEGEAEWSHDFPPAGPPEPDYSALLAEDPEAVTVRNALAPRVIVHAGAVASQEATTLASAHVGVVLEYVNGYTRGRGFHGMIPERDLQAVIVASAARLFTNPEQVTAYTMGDYSERPAVLAGWTLAEMAVLRRHRVTVR